MLCIKQSFIDTTLITLNISTNLKWSQVASTETWVNSLELGFSFHLISHFTRSKIRFWISCFKNQRSMETLPKLVPLKLDITSWLASKLTPQIFRVNCQQALIASTFQPTLRRTEWCMTSTPISITSPLNKKSKTVSNWKWKHLENVFQSYELKIKEEFLKKLPSLWNLWQFFIAIFIEQFISKINHTFFPEPFISEHDFLSIFFQHFSYQETEGDNVKTSIKARHLLRFSYF